MVSRGRRDRDTGRYRMHVPRYWRRVFQVVDLSRTPAAATTRELPQAMDIFSWGYSDVSFADAEARARQRLSEIVAHLRAPQGAEDFYYPMGVLREDAIRRIEQDGRERAVITRNRYHAHVLNTAELMLVDIDIDCTDLTPPSFLQRLFGQSAKVAARNRDVRLERIEQACQRVQSFADHEPDLGLRLYETYGGLRAIISSQPYAPRSDEASQIFDAFGSDPLFQMLCRAQNCFRARLTPKYWRMNPEIRAQLPTSPSIGMRITPDLIAKPDDARAAGWSEFHERRLYKYDAWVERYEALHGAHATCRFIRHVGNTSVPPRLQELVSLHDDQTQAHTQLALA
ncbi:MAG: hypothetical protein ACR2PA_12350 [Hyphomicrobiaceae bacterium]